MAGAVAFDAFRVRRGVSLGEVARRAVVRKAGASMSERHPLTGLGASPAVLEAGERWYVVRSGPRKEFYAAAHLGNQDFRVFVPRLRKTVRHARKTQTVLAALFPGYLFVAMDVDCVRWRAILGTHGVVQLIMAGDRPKPVPAGVVERLAEAADIAGAVNFAERLQVGAEVRFLTGPFADLVGRLVALDDAGRVGVLLEIMGSERVVTTTADALLPTD